VVSGRMLAGAVELWVLRRYVTGMLQADAAAMQQVDKTAKRRQCRSSCSTL